MKFACVSLLAVLISFPAHAAVDELGHQIPGTEDDKQDKSQSQLEDDFPSSRRNSWYIGFGIGGGFATLSNDTDSASWGEIFEGTDNSVRVSLDFHVGATLSDQLLFGGHIAAMRQEGEFLGADISLQHTQYLASLTYFPMPNGEGLFVRGGGGLAALMLEVAGFGFSDQEIEGGIGASAGLGYAFWVGETFNLTVSNDFHIGWFPGEDLTNWFDSILLGFMWY